MSKNNLEVITLNSPGVTDFAEARNKLLKKAAGHWVFFLDTDEEMTSELRQEINRAVNNRADSFEGYYVNRKNYFLGGYVGTDKILRLGRKNAGKWVRSVHETWNIKGSLGKLKNPVIHNTAGSVREMITKINFYSTLHAEANKLEGKKADLFKIIFYPKAKFVQSIFMCRGVVFSILQAFHSYLSWSKLWISQKN